MKEIFCEAALRRCTNVDEILDMLDRNFGYDYVMSYDNMEGILRIFHGRKQFVKHKGKRKQVRTPWTNAAAVMELPEDPLFRKHLDKLSA